MSICNSFNLETLGSQPTISKKSLYTFYQVHIVSTTICLIIFGAHMNILFNIQMNIVELHKWSNKYSQLCGLLSLKWLTIFEHVAQPFYNQHVFIDIHS